MIDFDKWIECGYLDELALGFDNPSEALEFVEYNTMRALPYFDDYAPIVIFDDIECII